MPVSMGRYVLHDVKKDEIDSYFLKNYLEFKIVVIFNQKYQPLLARKLFCLSEKLLFT